MPGAEFVRVTQISEKAIYQKGEEANSATEQFGESQFLRLLGDRFLDKAETFFQTDRPLSFYLILPVSREVLLIHVPE